MSERALILGGGGASGNAWTIGVVAGLFDGGVDVTSADLIVGTSAGATAAAQVTGPRRPPELLADILAAHDASAGRPAPSRPAANHMEVTGEIMASASSPGEMRRKLGAAALATEEASDPSRQAQWRATVAARLPSHDWPERALRIVAVDAESGEPVVFDRHSGVALVDAVAASCSNGFGVPPYTIGDHHYIDGAYRANENASLAAGCARVLVLSPLSGRSRHPEEWGTDLAAQVDALRAGGSRVETILPDADARMAMGSGLGMTALAARAPSARAGFEQGRALAARLADFWR